MTSEQRPPVYNHHYFWVPGLIVVHRFDYRSFRYSIVSSCVIFFVLPSFYVQPCPFLSIWKLKLFRTLRLLLIHPYSFQLFSKVLARKPFELRKVLKTFLKPLIHSLLTKICCVIPMTFIWVACSRVFQLTKILF